MLLTDLHPPESKRETEAFGDLRARGNHASESYSAPKEFASLSARISGATTGMG